MHTLLGLLLFATVFGQGTFHGPTYQRQTAYQKMSQLWSAVGADKTGLPWYGTLQEAELFLESMDISFDTVADDMPYQFFGLELRKKLIHTIGVAAQAKFVITNTSFGYTGLFNSGCDNAIVRFSLAQPAVDGNACTSSCFTPGISVKLLRDGVPSGTFLGLYSLLGQASYNFFEHDLSTQPPDFGSWASEGVQLVREKFATSSNFPTMLGVSNVAKYDQKGRQSTNPNFPFRVVFHPTTKWHNAFPSSNPGIPFQAQLIKTLTVGTVFDVYVQDTPDNSQLAKLGSLVLTGPVTTSTFGDKNYFIQHHRWEDDGALKPNWVAVTQEIQAEQRGTPAPGYTYPDLPWN